MNARSTAGRDSLKWVGRYIVVGGGERPSMAAFLPSVTGEATGCR